MAGFRTAGRWLGFLLVLSCFSAPLLYSLREPDMRNDEAIYSYAVERMVDTGDWVTPRSIPTHWTFFEKPPLKFWMVSAVSRSGILQRIEAGLRFLDGLFGGIALL